jgi:hypothetical protein
MCSDIQQLIGDERLDAGLSVLTLILNYSEVLTVSSAV